MALLGLVFLFLFSCKNPYIIHNMERPVYLTSLEIRSNILGDDDPSHSLSEIFQDTRLEYTVTVPHYTKTIIIKALPEEGAAVSGGGSFPFDSSGEAVFPLTVTKPHRSTTVYRVRIIRGLPEAELMGMELYIGEGKITGGFNALVLEGYEHDNYIQNFAPAREKYTVRVPAYTDHIGLVLKSYHQTEESKVRQLSYVFKDNEGRVIGVDGWNPDPSYKQDVLTTAYHKSPSPGVIGPVPTWYETASVDWGHIQIFPGQLADNSAAGSHPSWFGAGTIPAVDPAQEINPRARGMLATIEIIASSPDLSDKRYVIELQREEAAAYLESLGIFHIDKDSKDGKTGVGKVSGNMPLATGDVNDARSWLLGSFSRTTMNYEAALPESAGGLELRPVPDKHLTGLNPRFRYGVYYYDKNGFRYYVDSGGNKHEHQYQPPGILCTAANHPGCPFNHVHLTGDPPRDNDPAATPSTGSGANPVKLYFNVTGDPDFQDFVYMEVVIRSSADAPYVDRYYRIMIRRQLELATLKGVRAFPYKADTPGIYDPNVLVFDPAVNAQALAEVEAGRSHVRIVLDNDGAFSGSPSLNGSSENRIITVTSGNRQLTFRREGAGADTVWRDQNNTAVRDPANQNLPYADMELNGRNTQITIRVMDSPNYNPRDYTLYLLAKNTNQITLPPDSENDGRLRAFYAEGSKKDLTADNVLPGEKIRLTIDANLGFYIDETYNADGFVRGVRCTASGSLVMDQTSGVRQVSQTGTASKTKGRVYEFYMPDENVKFEAVYKATAKQQNITAYVAPEGLASRSGPYGSNINGFMPWEFDTQTNAPAAGPFDTGTSWGRATSNLQAVINGWTGRQDNFEKIWIHRGTYTPPDVSSDTYCFTTPGDVTKYKAAYTVQGGAITYYTFQNLSQQEDIAFVLRPGLRIYGGFEETDEGMDDRTSNAAEKTILSGQLSGGRRSYHVVLAVDATAATLDSMTIAYAIGPEEAGNEVTVGVSGKNRAVPRQSGGGIFSINSTLRLNNVIIRDNNSSKGAGMFCTVTNDVETMAPELTGVRFVNNNARESGGGLYNDTAKSALRVSESEFFQNKTSENGGGVYNNGGDTIFSNVVFNANSARVGGGIFTAGGNPTFDRITVKNNWTSMSGAGIYNSGNARFRDITVQANQAKGGVYWDMGSGIGIYNAGTMELTNGTLEDNVIINGSPSGGGLFNGGIAKFTNVTIRRNKAYHGGGIDNRGTLILVNAIVSGNSALVGGGGIRNVAKEDEETRAILVNVTLDSNTAVHGGGLFNDYEGAPQESIQPKGGVYAILANVQITGNESTGTGGRRTGGGIENQFYRYNGGGVSLTLSNTTVADNTGYGVYSVKDVDANYASYYDPADEEDGSAIDPWKRSFPVFVQYRNSVVYGNTLGQIWWGNNHFVDYMDTSGPGIGTKRENITYSLIGGKNLSGTNGNRDGTVGQSQVFSANYRPGAALLTGSSSLYLGNRFSLLYQLFWRLGSNHDGGLDTHLAGLPTFPGSQAARNIEYFLTYDNSFNVGDLRRSNYETNNNPGTWVEGPKKTRIPDIGAYER
jgi:hypothetical protein